ncbi:MAG TPA: hypothetical protein VL492_09190 [Methylovirgula sp.]|nr:hypothetical protein [Methylovirgula sp.]
MLDPGWTYEFRPTRNTGLPWMFMAPALFAAACVLAFLLLGGGSTLTAKANLILQNTEIDWASVSI